MSPSIYGDDDNDFASSVASSALGKPSADKAGSEEGSKGTRPQSKGPVKVTDLGMGSDSRAKSKGDCPK